MWKAYSLGESFPNKITYLAVDPEIADKARSLLESLPFVNIWQVQKQMGDSIISLYISPRATDEEIAQYMAVVGSLNEEE